MRSTLAGLLAGLSLVSAALLQPGPWTLPRVLGVIAGALVAVLGAVARDQGAPPALSPSVASLTRADVRELVAQHIREAAARPVDPPDPDAQKGGGA